MQPSPKVACVLVTTAKGMRYLPGLLDSIASQTFMEHETTVVINGTDSAVLEYLSANWPGVRVIPIHQPVGYAEAIDRGFRESSGEYIANLDDDLELEPDWLELLVAELEADERVGFVTGKTLLYDQRDVINETSQDLYTCGRFLPRGSEQSDLGQYDEPGPTTIASGSASVYRRRAVDRAGWFDVDFDIYCDESDLCLRMILCGYRGRYVPSARAYHAWSSTMGRGSDRSLYLGHRNTLITLVKDFPAPVLIRSLPKILRYQWWTYKLALADHWARTLVKAWTAFLRMLPATLRKRRRLQRRRAISSREFEGFLITDYPALPKIVRDPDEMLRFGPARLRLVALDLLRRRR